MIMIKLAIMALIEENVAYSLNEKGISLTYKGKIKKNVSLGADEDEKNRI